MTRHENMLSRREMIGIGLAAGLAGCSLPDAKLNHSSADIKTNSSENKQESELVIDNLTTVKGPSNILFNELSEVSINGELLRTCGKAYGTVFANLIHGWIVVLETTPSNSNLAKAADSLPYIEKFTPNSFEFLQGIAEGSGFSIEEIALLARCEEFLHEMDIENAKKQDIEHCTAFISSRTASKDHRTIVAQNIDIFPQAFPWASILKLECKDLPATIAFNNPGQWHGGGINSKGLTVMLTGTGWCPPTPVVQGVPVFMLVSELLSMDSVSEGINFLQEMQHASAYNILLGDASGKTAVVEAMPGRKPVIDVSPVNCRANHYETPELIEASNQNLDDPYGATTKVRSEEAHRVLKSCNEQPSVEIIKTALTTKPIFRDKLFHNTTIASLVACCEEKALWYCSGGLKPGPWKKCVL